MKTDQKSTPTVQTKGGGPEANTSKTKTMVAGLDGYDAQAAALATNEGSGGGLVTSGGSWKADAFAAFTSVNEDNSIKAGVEMKVLRFTPAAPVVSKKIGLVQSVLSTKTSGGKSEKNFGNDPYREQRSTKEGSNIDKAAGTGSPFFAAPRKEWNDKKADLLTSIHAEKNKEAYGHQPDPTPPTKLGAAQLEQQTKTRDDANTGSVFGSRTEAGDVVDATLLDKIGTTWKPATETSTLFETTAVALEGPQKDVYLGSVKWGLHIAATDSEPKIDVVPLEVLDKGAPTAEFMAATAAWNNAPAYDHTMYYDKAKAKGKPYTQDANARERVDLIEANGVAVLDGTKEKPNPAKWGSATVHISNEKLAVLDRARYDSYLAKARPVAQDPAKLAALKAALEQELAKEQAAKKTPLNPEVAAVTWKNVEFALAAEAPKTKGAQ